MLSRLLLLTLCWSVLARAEEGYSPLDQALELVLAVSPALSAERLQLTAVSRQPAWQSRILLRYAAQADARGAAREFDVDKGLNARLEVEIPLFDRQREIEALKTRRQLAEAEQTLIDAFLGDVRELVKLHGARQEVLALTEFYTDRLRYHQQAEREGLIEASELWAHAEAAKKAEYAAKQSLAACETLLEGLARQYGGSQWPQLHALLVAHLTATLR